MNFSDRLKNVIEKSGLKREEFAERAGVSRRQLFNYLGDSSEPTLAFFQRIKTEFSWIDLEWLMTGNAINCTSLNLDRETRIINQMLEGMTEEQKAEVRKYAEDKKLLAELLAERQARSAG